MNNQKPPISRIAIVEDDPNLLDHFIEIISGEENLDLAGAASSVRGARDLIRLEPDLFLLDIGLPDGSGLDLVPEIRAAIDTNILIITSFGDRDTVVNAIRTGADGYLLKDSRPDVITDGIHATLNGGAPVSAAAAIYLLDQLRGDTPLVEQAIEAYDGLSDREVELLNLFARGLTYRESAEQMGLSPLTIGSYVKSVYSKLAVNSRSEAVYEALKTGQLTI
ncbi:MAG: response regulator transcription factor [Pseudomonadota bacterium]